MVDRLLKLVIVVAFAAAACAAPAFAQGSDAAAPSDGVRASIDDDNDIPGVPIAPSPMNGDLDSRSDRSDVCRLWLNEGEVFGARLTVTTASAAFSPALFLYPPGTATTATSPDWVAASQQATFPKTLTYTATRTGYYYLDVFQSPYTVEPVSGATLVTWAVSSPVYRFYNAGSGTHFFTPTLDERNMVIALWSDVYLYEGIAYFTQPYANPQPLYRFYNTSSKSHFYTASPAECEMVIARWPHIFAYEGETYRVSPTGPDGAAVYRFYNVRNGSHFFTASASERDSVIAGLGGVYHYEGVAFYLNP